MTTIPKKWKVRITESNREVLEQWRIKQPNVDQDPKITCINSLALNFWLVSDRWDGSYMNWGGGDSYQEITFEEFKKYVLMKTYNIKISDLKKIHDVACGSWKTKIKSLITDPFAESIELTQTQVDEMFKAATTDQRPVLVEVFGEPVSYKKGQLLWMWDEHWKYPSVRKFLGMDGSKFKAHINDGSGTATWDYASPFNNGQLPDQFKHLLENQ